MLISVFARLVGAVLIVVSLSGARRREPPLTLRPCRPWYCNNVSFDLENYLTFEDIHGAEHPVGDFD